MPPCPSAVESMRHEILISFALGARTFNATVRSAFTTGDYLNWVPVLRVGRGGQAEADE